MARRFPIVLAALICAPILPAAAPAPAGADGFDAFYALAKRRINPPPLVPITAPPALQPIDKYIGGMHGGGKTWYLFRITRDLDTPNPIVVAVEGGKYKSLAAAKRGESLARTRAKRTTVRGHKGYLLTDKKPKGFELIWPENGGIYSVGSGTGKKISVKQLRDVASSLDRLERDYGGSAPYDPALGGGQSAIVVSTVKTVSLHVSWTGACTQPGGTATSPRSGSVSRSLINRQGNNFSIAPTPVAGTGGDGAGGIWTFSGSGTIGPGVATLSFRASGVIDGTSCDTGPVSITLDQRALTY